ncbi:TadE/TadG family type IV pilus assembly protein [Novosphingobium malaysiense]|nr:TadE family protein [Novosphingobium malaysiense]
MERANLLAIGDESGASAVEFALVAPVLLMAMMGLFDLGYNVYTATLLEGAIQKAARDSTIEGSVSKTSTLDGRVTDMVRNIAPQAQLTFKRTAYASFSDVGKPEDFTDVNNDGMCDAGEPFEDANGNGVWDADQGKAGSGGARDAVLYEVKVTYPRPFPVTAIFGMSADYAMTSRTVLRNQPYNVSEKTVKVLNCP